MKIKLSSFLQWKCNVFIYRFMGWKIALFYLIILGKSYFFFKRKEKQKIETAIDSVFPADDSDHEKRSIKKKVFRGILLHYYEKIFNAYENIKELNAFFEKSIDATCLKKLDDALKKGKGLLFVTGHYGGIEYIPIFLALKKYPVSAVARFSKQQLKDEICLKTRDLGFRIIDANKRTNILATIIKELRANRIVFTECDEIEEWRPSQKEKTFFLGKMIGVDKTINIIQKRTGAEVVLGLLHRHNLRQYSLIMERRQDILSRPGKTPSSVGEAILKAFEQYVYTYPEEWYQWKNYAEIRANSSIMVGVEKQSSSQWLKPAFNRV